MSMKRRDFLDLAAATAALAAIPMLGGCSNDVPAPPNDSKPGENSVQQIAMLVYPNFTALDLIGPQTIFASLTNVEVHLVWKTLEPIKTDTGVTVMPTKTFDECPEMLEVLFVPGGTAGTVAMMNDVAVLDFLEARAANATYVTSVCTGSLVLGAAGLLRGYQATTHWIARSILPLLEATSVDARYVEDKNRITGAGVTSGIDFGLRIAAKLRGTDYAQAVQLNMEYAPDPPFNAGSPATADPAIVKQLEDMYAPFVVSAKAAAESAKSRFTP